MSSKIIFIPLDNRPVSYTLPEQIVKMHKDAEFLLPPRELLGGLVKNSDVDAILEWIDKTLQKQMADYIVVSLDTIAHGGLIPSRRSLDTPQDIINRLEKFRGIAEKSNAKIYAFSSIMRISDSYVNEEEKEYWDKYGKEIFNYSFWKHKGALTGEYKEWESKIPFEILDDYIKTRERNFSINRYYLKWLEEKFLDYLVFSKDDTGQFGLNVQESEALDAEIQAKNLCNNAIVQTGADEIPSDLVSRAICEYISIKVYPLYSTASGKNTISRYEDRTIEECAAAQIRLCGGMVVDSQEDADMILLMHTPQNVQNDHCLNIHVEKDNKDAVAFCIDYIQNSKKPIMIGDISCANGGDNLLVTQLITKALDTDKIYSYSGWNTTGNTLGSTLSLGLSRFAAEKNGNFDIENYKKALFIRLADDWAYQTIVRQTIRAYTNIADKKMLKEEMFPLARNLVDKLGLFVDNFEFSFPWERTFEVEVVI
jgi:hypothetical protein